jgi:putative tRNA adenosine deaminase-associated protein
VTYIASVLTRSGSSWGADDLDLSGVEDLDALVDRLREAVGDPTLCLVEEDDEYVAIVRVDGENDPRVFVSDRRVLEAEGVAGRLLADAVEAEPDEVEDTEDEESSRPEVEPAGDDALLADLGIPAAQLRDLCSEEGMLPSDTIFAVAEALGAGDELERVRGL